MGDSAEGICVEQLDKVIEHPSQNARFAIYKHTAVLQFYHVNAFFDTNRKMPNQLLFFFPQAGILSNFKFLCSKGENY